jgi:hypothetical protein
MWLVRCALHRHCLLSNSNVNQLLEATLRQRRLKPVDTLSPPRPRTGSGDLRQRALFCLSAIVDGAAAGRIQEIPSSTLGSGRSEPPSVMWFDDGNQHGIVSRGRLGATTLPIRERSERRPAPTTA